MLASVVIGTYNRAAALPATLDALARQDVAADDYEVLVIDDGSADHTQEVLAAASVPYPLRVFRLPVNRGVSASRNVGLRNATGRYVILLSDDLVVPPDFIRTHVATLERFPDAWVVGGFSQLPSLTATPFGRYLDRLERSFERARMAAPVGDGLYEMTTPTCRNMSMRVDHVQRVGLFDERFRITCEDQDLAERASRQGVRFIYNAALESVHNDQAADLSRYCRFQRLGAADTVRLCQKYPALHGEAEIVRVNGWLARGDGAWLAARKLAKRALCTDRSLRLIGHAVAVGERIALPDRALRRGYRALIGLHIFRGFREGLRESGS